MSNVRSMASMNIGGRHSIYSPGSYTANKDLQGLSGLGEITPRGWGFDSGVVTPESVKTLPWMEGTGQTKNVPNVPVDYFVNREFPVNQDNNIFQVSGKGHRASGNVKGSLNGLAGLGTMANTITPGDYWLDPIQRFGVWVFGPKEQTLSGQEMLTTPAPAAPQNYQQLTDPNSWSTSDVYGSAGSMISSLQSQIALANPPSSDSSSGSSSGSSSSLLLWIGLAVAVLLGTVAKGRG